MVSGENISRASYANDANVNVNITGTAANIPDGAQVAPAVPDVVVSTGNASSAPLPTLVSPAQAMVVMMEHMRQLQERMVSIASAIGNAADVSGARAFLRDFASDAGRMQARLQSMIVNDAPIAPVAPIVADNAPVAPVAPVVVNEAPAPSPVVAATGNSPLAAHADVLPPVAASAPHAPMAESVLTPPVLPPSAIPMVTAHELPPIADAVPANVNPSPVALTRTAQPSAHSTDSAAFAQHGLQSSLSNISLPAMPTFALHADPVPWLTGLRARLNLCNFTDAARVNVAVSLLSPEVQNVWAHAFPAGIQCTFDDFCEWLSLNFGKHDADDDVIRKLQSLRQRGKIAAYCAEFLALWNKLQSKPDESLQIKWFRQGLQQRVHDATLYDENNADWSSFSRLQAAVLRADARIHSHTSHCRETEPVRSERRMMPGLAPRPSGSFQRRGFRGGRRGGPNGHTSSHGSAPRPTMAPHGHSAKRPRSDGPVVQCYNCSDFGHKANVCTKPRRGGRFSAPTGQRPQGARFPSRSGHAGPSSAPRQGNASTR